MNQRKSTMVDLLTVEDSQPSIPRQQIQFNFTEAEVSHRNNVRLSNSFKKSEGSSNSSSQQRLIYKTNAGQTF